MQLLSRIIALVLVLIVGALPAHAQQKSPPFEVKERSDAILISTQNYQLRIYKDGFRYRFERPGGEVFVPAHPTSGLQLAPQGEPLEAVRTTTLSKASGEDVVLAVETDAGLQAEVRARPGPHQLRFSVRPQREGAYTLIGRTGGVSPAYGLADHAAFGHGQWDEDVRSKTELTGFTADPLSGYRMVSNFVIFPQQGFAEVNIEPQEKIVRFTEEENAQGSKGVRSMPALYYFVGSPEQIYKRFLEVRSDQGYPFYKPKYAMFGVGWEAFGALSWNTRHETVVENIETYLDEGYPLKWMVVGSGFWPRAEEEFDEHGTPYDSETASAEAKKLLATTSFGMWDETLYPDPEGFIDHFHERGLKFLIGLRIGFIPGGPFTDEGLDQGYFLTENGEPKQYDVGFPEPPVYLLDSRNPEAVEWYVDLAEKWLDSGVDGFKEDLFGWPQHLPDDLIDPVNRLMMDRGVYLIGRNNYLGSPADIHRYNDFNYNQPQDRGPINGLAYAYSGFPYVYPDIVGGTGLATGRFGDVSPDTVGTYLMRYAQYAAVNPSMSFGYGPWKLDDEQVNQVALEAARLHDRLLPYIYDAVLDTYETGFPYTMTPLPLAYPDDPGVYNLANTERRAYEWLIGESLLATPLYGDDYATAETRDLYLPEGIWVDYDTGTAYEGPRTLEDFPLPVGKTPLFVGGKGIVVEQRDGQLEAWVYPIRENTSFTFSHRSGSTSEITVDVAGWEAPNVQVIDQNRDAEVETRQERGAVVFAIEPGHDYLVHSQK